MSRPPKGPRGFESLRLRHCLFSSKSIAWLGVRRRFREKSREGTSKPAARPALPPPRPWQAHRCRGPTRHAGGSSRPNLIVTGLKGEGLQNALTTPPVARCITSFSGPIERSWLSLVRCRQNGPGAARTSSRSAPTTRRRIARIAIQNMSLPRPMLMVSPCPCSTRIWRNPSVAGPRASPASAPRISGASPARYRVRSARCR